MEGILGVCIVFGAGTAHAEQRRGLDRGQDAGGIRREWAPRSGHGVGLVAGGGVTNFTGGSAQDATSVGGTWEARLTYGTRRLLALELTYVGSGHWLDVPGAADDVDLMRHGAEATLRLNGRFVAGGTLIEPFVFGGYGWNMYSPRGSTGGITKVSSDHIMVVPVGGGLTVSHRGFLAEARFAVRPTMEEDLFGNGDLQSWAATLSLGYEF